MAHLDTGQAKVRVSNWTGTAWNNVTVGDANYGTYTYDRPHIATGPGNEVAVAYIKRPENRLMVAKRVGSTWQEQLVDTVGAAGRPEIAFLSTGKRVVFYHTSSQGTHQAFFAEELGSGWDLRFIANVGSLGGRTSMMLGPNDQPHIAFFDYNSGALKYGTRTAGNWSIETAGYGGYSISIALDKNGKPAIAYTTLSPLTLRVATIGSSGYWTSETVDVGSSRPVLAFDESGRAHIAAESDSDRIRYAVRGPTGWDVKTVEVAGEVKTSIGLAVQSTGEAWIPFQSDNQLKVLH